jgi:mRNA-degrading endonuclease HigB of HigAB toxin-antitoxin module
MVFLTHNPGIPLAGALRDSYKLTSAAAWRSFADVRATFGQTDQVKLRSGQTVCVFDIGGNKFRLVAFISYAKGKVYVLRVMTHIPEAGAHQIPAELVQRFRRQLCVAGDDAQGVGPRGWVEGRLFGESLARPPEMGLRTG